MKTVLYWKLVSVTMWPGWCISTLRGNNVWVCAFALRGVFVISGSRTWASVWHSCCFAFRKKTERSKKFFIDLQAKEHITTMVNPKPCGHLCCCIIKGCEQVRGHMGAFIFKTKRQKQTIQRCLAGITRIFEIMIKKAGWFYRPIIDLCGESGVKQEKKITWLHTV